MFKKRKVTFRPKNHHLSKPKYYDVLISDAKINRFFLIIPKNYIFYSSGFNLSNAVFSYIHFLIWHGVRWYRLLYLCKWSILRVLVLFKVNHFEP